MCKEELLSILSDSEKAFPNLSQMLLLTEHDDGAWIITVIIVFF